MFDTLYEIKRIDAALPLESELLKKFASLAPEEYRIRDPGKHSNTTNIIIGALFQGTLIGLALANCYKLSHQVDVLFLFVQQEHRCRHLGRQLLSQLVKEAKKEGGRFFSLIYLQEDPSTPALEKVFSANQWESGHPFLVHCVFNGFTFNPPWIHHAYQFPDSFEEFPWSSLSDEERKELLLRLNNRAIPAAVSPFLDEKMLEPLNSLGLRHRGRIVGWMLTHRTGPDTIRYTSLYIESDLQFLGPGVKLLTDAILIQKKSAIKWAVFDLPLLHVSSSWMRFIKRRLIPYAQAVSLQKQATFYTR